LKICIIGGRGQMGRLFEKIFLSKGHSVVIQGRQRYSELKDDVSSSDVIIVSVPLDVASKVIDDVSDVVSDDKLVVDFSSVMSKNVEAMECLDCESAFVHPLFGPGIDSLKNMNFAVVGLNKGQKLKWLVDFLKEEDANVVESTVDEHDAVMAVIQGLTHFNNLAFGKTLVDEGLKDKGFETTLFRMNKRLVSRMFAQEPHVSENIQFMNDKVVDILCRHKKNLDEVYEIVKKKDNAEFERVFKGIASELAVKSDMGVKVKKPVRKWDKDAVAVLGPRGSYTDAALECDKKVYVDSISEVISAVGNGDVKLGVVPLENSIQGTVTEALDGINSSEVFIKESIVMPIHHCCAGLGGDVDTVLSHPQAIQQCSKYISSKFHDAKVFHTLSTTEAFQKIKEKGLTNAVAIGPSIAASIYGLKIIDENVEDLSNNKTKFVVLSKEMGNGSVTSIVVLPFNEKQGILYKLLGCFDEGKINLTKIESRPVKDEFGVYLFYIDFDGDVSDSSVKKCLDKIKKEVGEVKILGSYDTVER